MITYYQPYWLRSDEIEHHGILGMKWGIRRYQNKDGSLTTLGKKRLSKGRLKSGMYSRDNSEDISFPKGTKLYRMTYSDSDPSKGLYVTRNEMDRNYYKQNYSSSLMGVGEDPKNLKENVYTTNEELKIPSWDKRKAAFDEVANNKKLRSEIAEDLAAQYVRRNALIKVSSLKDANDYLKNATLDKEQKANLKKIIGESSKYGKTKVKDLDEKNPLINAQRMSQIIGASEKARNAYIDILKKQGYNATVDDFGRKGLWGSQGETSESLIIFDSSSASKKSSKNVSSYNSIKLNKKVTLADYKYDANVLGDKPSKEMLKIYKNVNMKSKISTIGGFALGLVVPGGYMIVDNLYRNSAIKAANKIRALEEEKRKNYQKV